MQAACGLLIGVAAAPLPMRFNRTARSRFLFIRLIVKVRNGHLESLGEGHCLVVKNRATPGFYFSHLWPGKHHSKACHPSAQIFLGYLGFGRFAQAPEGSAD